MHQSISLLSVESRAITVRVPGVLEQAVEDHRKIAGRSAGKPVAARSAMHRHLENVRVSLFAARDAQEAAEDRIATQGFQRSHGLSERRGEMNPCRVRDLDGHR